MFGSLKGLESYKVPWWREHCSRLLRSAVVGYCGPTVAVWKRVGVFIRCQGRFLSVFLAFFGFSAAASAAPFDVAGACNGSVWVSPAEAGQSGCGLLFPVSEGGPEGMEAAASWVSLDSVEFVRLATPFSWNFASAFERLPPLLRDELVSGAPLRSGHAPRVRGEDAYCEAGCSTTLSSVPEPATMVLFGSALMLLGALVRSRANVG